MMMKIFLIFFRSKFGIKGTTFKTDIDSHNILDADFDYESFDDKKIKFKTEQKRFEIDLLFKIYLGKKFRRKNFLPHAKICVTSCRRNFLPGYFKTYIETSSL